MTDQEIDRLTHQQRDRRSGQRAADRRRRVRTRSDRPGYYPSRDMLDREMREIKDEVLRMGSLVADQIGVAIDALVEHDAEKATDGDRRRRAHQRGPAPHQRR